VPENQWARILRLLLGAQKYVRKAVISRTFTSSVVSVFSSLLASVSF
jgi:hypothetical protein